MYVIGVDPPNAWAVWTVNGVAAWGQAPDKMTSREARAGIWHDARTFIGDVGQQPRIVAIEKPYGGMRNELGEVSGEMLKSLLDQADSGGWLEGRFEHPDVVITRPMAGEWRKPLGLIQAPRQKAKKHAIEYASLAVEQTMGSKLVGPKGGEREHAADAICIAMSAWVMLGVWRDNPSDAYFKWTKKGLFGELGQGELHAADEERTSQIEPRQAEGVGDDSGAAVGGTKADR